MTRTLPVSQTLISCLILGLLALAAFLGVIHNGFVYVDDHVYIYLNDHVNRGLTWEGIKWAFTADLTQDGLGADYWRPLTFLSHMADVSLFGLNAGAHHAVSLGLHIINACLVFLLLFRLTGCHLRSLLAAALFAMHPLQTEAVAWATARKDILSTCLGMLTLHAYLSIRTSSRYGILRFAVLILFLLSLTAKVMMITIPFLMILIDFWNREKLPEKLEDLLRDLRASLKAQWPFWALALVFIPLPFVGQSKAFPFDPLLHFWRIFDSYGFYLSKFLLPVNLSMYGPVGPFTLSTLNVAMSLIVLFAITMLLYEHLPRSRTLALGWLWFLGTLAPVIALPWPADRFLYLPMTGLSILFVWGLHAAGGKKLAALICGLIILLFLPLSRAQVKVWKNNETLAINQVQSDPANPVLANDYANVLAMAGKQKEALTQYLRAIELDPNYYIGHYNLANLYLDQGRFERALLHADEVIRQRGSYGRIEAIRNAAIRYQAVSD